MSTSTDEASWSRTSDQHFVAGPWGIGRPAGVRRGK